MADVKFAGICNRSKLLVKVWEIKEKKGEKN